jgi:ribosomal protein S18 acetylase RimI-like enzyme
VHGPREGHLLGLDYLEAAVDLLRRIRAGHPTRGLYEAADVQWWWRTPRSTDAIPQLFWFDRDDRPIAATILTDWGDGAALDPIAMPDSTPDVVDHIVARGVAHAARYGFESVSTEVDRDDHVLRDVLTHHGFVVDESGLVECWLPAGARPPVSPLHEDYRLASRLETAAFPHHMIGRSGAEVEARLCQTPMYRPDLDLVVLDPDDRPAAYGLFWFDPVTSTGLVEPMRTESSHQRRGLARHVLGAGVERLARAGADRIKICVDVDNTPARDLYVGSGFAPVKQTDLFASRPGD